MRKIVNVALLVLLVGGTFALPVQEAVAATGCRTVNGQRVCGTTTHPKTVCTTTTAGVKHCRKVY